MQGRCNIFWRASSQAVSKPMFGAKFLFCSVFRDLLDLRSFVLSLVQTQCFLKILEENKPKLIKKYATCTKFGQVLPKRWPNVSQIVETKFDKFENVECHKC